MTEMRIAIALVIANLALWPTHEPHLTSVAGLAWDGSRVIAVWETEAGDDVYVHFGRFDLRDGVTTVKSGNTIHHRKYGTAWHTPEIGLGAYGALVVLNPFPGKQLAIPLDRDGVPHGPPQKLTACEKSFNVACYDLCRRAVVPSGDGYIVGHIWSPPVSGLNALSLSVLDRDGKTTGEIFVADGDPRACAMAKLGDGFVIAYDNTDEARELSTIVEWRDAHGALVRTARVERGYPIAMVGEALLYARTDGVRLARFDEHSDKAIAGIDPTTADLGADDNGLFITWIADGKARVQHVGGATRSRRVSKATGTRAIGAGTRSVAAWTTYDNARLQFFVTQ